MAIHGSPIAGLLLPLPLLPVGESGSSEWRSLQISEEKHYQPLSGDCSSPRNTVLRVHGEATVSSH